MNDELAAELLWVLIEGPGPGDAEFLGRWLLAAVEADQTLEEQFKRNTALKDQISRVEIVYHVRFSSGATRFIELLMKNLTSFTLSIGDEWCEGRNKSLWIEAEIDVEILRHQACDNLAELRRLFLRTTRKRGCAVLKPCVAQILNVCGLRADPRIAACVTIETVGACTQRSERRDPWG